MLLFSYIRPLKSDFLNWQRRCCSRIIATGKTWLALAHTCPLYITLYDLVIVDTD